MPDFTAVNQELCWFLDWWGSIQFKFNNSKDKQQEAQPSNRQHDDE